MTEQTTTEPAMTGPDLTEPVAATAHRGQTVTVAGRVVRGLRDSCFALRDLAGIDHEVEVSDGTAAELLRNLGDPYLDASRQRDTMLQPGRAVLITGLLYSGQSQPVVDAKRIVFVGRGSGDYTFEDRRWWIHQLDRLAAFYRRAQFGDGQIDYADYRTQLRLDGHKTADHVQETDTISRLVYGMASAYQLTGEEDYLDVAERGVEYLREHMRFADADEGIVYWYHGIRLTGTREKKLFTSEFGDDYDAVPMYEQIYALAGPAQTLRVNGDPRIVADAESTLRLFERHFRDRRLGGYFSHIDPVQLDPHSSSLGPNQSRKNWNSVGDHAPAYLINLYLATGDPRHAQMLRRTYDCVVEHFPDPGSPFVKERFHADWSYDSTHGWQQDRAVVGHNLKIAWNLMRINSLRPDPRYPELAERIGRTMPAVGSDRTRGGWYDVVERRRRAGEDFHRFVWHDRKAWWQQEQAILAYFLLAGITDDRQFLDEARFAAAFYNAFFLDQDEGGVYFNVLADGFPYLLGTERLKGSHSMSMYHAAELCYLSAVYVNLLVQRQPLTLWFKPLPDGFGPDRVLRVAPDLLPPGSVRLRSVQVDGAPYEKFDPVAMTVQLPDSSSRLTVQATVVPAER